jgi:hypothetical protein
MKQLGDEVYIQRGEDWTLDFSITNKRGNPFMLLKVWDNPYIVITVTTALYEQVGDFRETYWLDVSERYIERADGSYVLEPIKKFISTEALYLSMFSANEAIEMYGINNGGKMVFDKTSDFDVTNYLFFVDEHADGNYTYKYLKDYSVTSDGVIEMEEWEEYNFRIIKQFDTKNWIEQRYLFDIKLLAGESLQEHIALILISEGYEYDVDFLSTDWSDTELQNFINLIKDDTHRAEMQALFDEGVPLMPNYDTKSLILQPTKLYVSADIQGGVR